MAQTEEQLQLAEAGAKDLGFESVAEAKDTLSTETLQDTPDFQVKDSDVPTAGAGLEGAIEAETDAFTENLKQQREDAQATKEESQTEIQDILSQIRGETGLTIEAENKAGVPEVEKELLDINQQIRTEQQALRRQIERIEDNEAGLFGGAVSDKAEEAKRSSLRKQADLSVIQMGIQGRFDSAKAIADRAVNAQMERQEIILDTAMFNYQENKELFTTAEQREFEALASKRERDIEDERSKLQEISDYSVMAMQEGAPSDVVRSIREAKTPEEAQMLASKYIGPIIRKQRQLDQDEQELANYETRQELGLVGTTEEEIANELPTFDDYVAQWEDATSLTMTEGMKDSLRPTFEMERQNAIKELVPKTQAQQTADNIMSGVMDITDVLTKNREAVGNVLKEKQEEALATGDFEGLLRASAVFDKSPDSSFLTSMDKAGTVLEQLGSLQANISDADTGPIVGAFREKNPWDTQAQTIKAQLNAIVPNLARGIYGEVGVLTDNDIRTYSKTIPNLTSTEDIRNAILYITVDMVRKSIERKIKSQVAGQRDMSGFVGTYNDVNALASDILKTLPTPQTQADTSYVEGLEGLNK